MQDHNRHQQRCCALRLRHNNSIAHQVRVMANQGNGSCGSQPSLMDRRIRAHRVAVQRQATVEAVNEAWAMVALLTLAGALAVCLARSPAHGV
jgi:hypothetical protein